jgi:carbon-monoxide dehydrogenase large subunit
VINEPAVHEQVIGGIATGIGNALYEEIVYDDDGEIRTSSLLDYLVPLVGDVPPIDLHHLETPSDRTTLGTKGVAEAGTIGAMGAIGSAVNDALRQLGAECNDVPLTPQRLFDAVERARGA